MVITENPQSIKRNFGFLLEIVPSLKIFPALISKETFLASSFLRFSLSPKVFLPRKKFLTTFKADDSFFITRLLIDGCPYSHVVGLLLDIVLTNTQASFTSHQPDGGGHSIYLSSAPSELAWKVIDGLKDSDLCDAAETYSSALSLFRYVLIRDAKTNYCELWPGIVTRKLEVLNQLHAETKTRIGTRTGDAGAALSAKSQQSLQMEVLRLNLLLDILDRILELVTNDARYKLLSKHPAFL